ncbi:Protein of unknown function [Gryllus bimaculatus]|nr:Protein of unknown function [Gryllus bimaculatus]
MGISYSQTQGEGDHGAAHLKFQKARSCVERLSWRREYGLPRRLANHTSYPLSASRKAATTATASTSAATNITSTIATTAITAATAPAVTAAAATAATGRDILARRQEWERRAATAAAAAPLRGSQRD